MAFPKPMSICIGMRAPSSVASKRVRRPWYSSPSRMGSIRIDSPLKAIPSAATGAAQMS